MAAPETYALVSGQDANGFPFMSDHHAAGVSQTSFDRIVGIAGIAADATADFGSMHLRSEARSYQVGMPMFIAGASTFWQDDLTITGGSGSAVAGITVRLDGVFTNEYGDGSPSSQDAGYVRLVAEVNPTPSGPAEQTPIDLLVHNLSSGPLLVGGTDLQDGMFTFTYGQPFTLKVAVGVISQTSLDLDLGLAIADFTTVKLEFLTLPAGAVVTAASGTTYPQGSAASTTTTAASPSTTTSTLVAGGCGLSQGFDLARCRIDAILAAPLCATGSVPSKLDHVVRAKLAHVRTLVDDAEHGAGKKRRHLLGAAHHLLQSLKAKTQKTFRKHLLDETCRMQISGVLDTVDVAIGSL